jgi:hypothetical protein
VCEDLERMFRGLLILLLLSGCSRFSESDPKGHWVSLGYFTNSSYQTLDIGDSTVIVNKLGLYRATFEYFKSDNPYIELLGGHNSILFSVIGDTLLFDGAGIGDSLFVRVEDNFSKSDILCDLHLSVELPMDEDDFCVEFTKDSIVSYICVGKLKSGFSLLTNEGRVDSFRIQVNDTFIKVDELDDFIKMERTKIIEIDRDKLVIAIFADKNVELDYLNLIVDTIRKSSPLTTVYLSYYSDRNQKFLFKEMS